jgi:hypothetical protein
MVAEGPLQCCRKTALDRAANSHRPIRADDRLSIRLLASRESKINRLVHTVAVSKLDGSS